MCKLVGRLFTRTVDKLGEVRVRVRSCGELFKLPWSKIWKGTALVAKKVAVKVQNSSKTVQSCASVAVKALEEIENQ